MRLFPWLRRRLKIEELLKRIPPPLNPLSFSLSKRGPHRALHSMLTRGSKNRKKSLYILNNTAAREPCHLGCAVVMRNLSLAAKKYGMTVRFSDASEPGCDFDRDEFAARVSECDCLILNGEGTLHDDAAVRYLERCQIAKELHKTTILVNTVWENNVKLNSFLDCFDLISARESFSYAALIEGGAKRELVSVIPDLCFYDSTLFSSTVMRQDKLCFTDSAMGTYTQKIGETAKAFSAPFFMMSEWLRLDKNIFQCPPGRMLDDFGLLAAPYVVSGRFHAACFCFGMGIPVLSVAANTYKTEGMLCDAGIPPEKYFIRNCEALTEDRIHSFMEMDHTDYIELSKCYATSAVDKINGFFERINDL